MAVQFPDASNRCSWGPPIGTTGAFSVAFRINPAGGGNVRIVDANQAFINANGTTQFQFERSYSTTNKFCRFDSAWTFGTEVHIVITDDGTTDAAGVIGYANGSVLTHSAGVDINGSGTPETDDGCQLGHATIAFPCTISELAFWHRVLTANEIASLSTGRCSPLYFQNSLRAYMPMWDIVTTAGLREVMRNLTATIATAGIVKAAHPRIYYPPSSDWRALEEAAASATGSGGSVAVAQATAGKGASVATGFGSTSSAAQATAGKGASVAAGKGATLSAAQVTAGVGGSVATGSGGSVAVAQATGGKGAGFGLATGSGGSLSPAQATGGKGASVATGKGGSLSPVQATGGKGASVATGSGGSLSPAQVTGGKGGSVSTGKGGSVAPAQVTSGYNPGGTPASGGGGLSRRRLPPNREY